MRTIRVILVLAGALIIAFLVRYSAGSARAYARDNAAYSHQFEEAASLIREHRAKHSDFPRANFFDGTILSGFEIYRNRPRDPAFDFPEWRVAGSFAIGRWNGDYMEWYDSESGISTTSHKDTHTKVVLSLWPNFLSGAFLVFLGIFIGNKKKSNKATPPISVIATG